jgi:formylglycine-generating enzyme required for sulfatase activity
LDYGRNIPLENEPNVLPLGQFAPNPLGLYDMTGNATDWVNDWYDPAYYRKSPADNPQGPESGTQKIRRGTNGAEIYWMSANTVRRWPDNPIKDANYPALSFRCAIQFDQAL